MDFFQELAKSKFVDSYSLYTLELFPGSIRYYKEKKRCHPEQSEGSNLDFSAKQDY